MKESDKILITAAGIAAGIAALIVNGDATPLVLMTIFVVAPWVVEYIEKRNNK